MTTDYDDDGSSRIRRTELVSTEDDLESPLDRRPEFRSRRDRRSRSRNTILGFAALGALCFLAALVVADGRDVLFALAGVGGVAAILTYAATPGSAIDARDGARVYGTGAANVDRLLSELGAAGDERYVPETREGTTTVGLVVPGSGGPPLEPIGGSFVRELDGSAAGGLASDPGRLAEQVTDALVDRFEVVDRAAPVVHAGRVEVTVDGSAFGPVDRFDHPVVSILAVALAAGLDCPVETEVTADPDRGTWLVSCRWEAADATG